MHVIVHFPTDSTILVVSLHLLLKKKYSFFYAKDFCQKYVRIVDLN